MPKQKIELERGKTYNMSYTHPAAMTGGTVFFTMKPVQFDTDAVDAAATIKKSVTSFTNSDRTASWVLTDSDTYVTPAKYQYDIVFEDATGASLPASWFGEANVTAHPTNRNV